MARTNVVFLTCVVACRRCVVYLNMNWQAQIPRSKLGNACISLSYVISWQIFPSSSLTRLQAAESLFLGIEFLREILSASTWSDRS